MQRPLTSEYRPFFQRYIDLVPDEDIVEVLRQQKNMVATFLSSLPADKHDFRYAEGKWSIKQVLMHIIDTERVMSYRALVAARGDNDAILCSMDENKYAEACPYSGRSMESIIDEFNAMRVATIYLLENVTDAQSTLTARNTDGTTFSTRSLAYIIAGHLLHHMHIVRERYL